MRNLERLIGSVCRGIAAKVARKTRISKVVRPEDLQQYLGAQRFERETALDDAPAGVATGLAYTPVGGDLIFIEALAMPGRGGFQLTGQIGDVMRESAQAALSLVRSRAARWGISLENLPTLTCTYTYRPVEYRRMDRPRAWPSSARFCHSSSTLPCGGASHDRRNHTEWARLADRRAEGKAPGRSPRRIGHDHPAGSKSAGPRRGSPGCTRRPQAHLCQTDRRCDRGGVAGGTRRG